MDREDVIRYELGAWCDDNRTVGDLEEMGLGNPTWVDFSCRKCDFSAKPVLQVEDADSGDRYSMCPECRFLYAEVDD